MIRAELKPGAPPVREADTTRRRTPSGKWMWLFPVTYPIHIAEEYWAGEGFPAWVSRVAGVGLTPTQFLILNGVAWVLMVAGSVLVVKTASMRWLLISFSTVVLLNGLLHFIASVVTGSYSPGLLSGMLLWVPLGAFFLFRLWAGTRRRTFLHAALVGIAIHGVVFLLAFYTGRIMS